MKRKYIIIYNYIIIPIKHKQNTTYFMVWYKWELLNKLINIHFECKNIAYLELGMPVLKTKDGKVGGVFILK